MRRTLKTASPRPRLSNPDGFLVGRRRRKTVLGALVVPSISTERSAGLSVLPTFPAIDFLNASKDESLLDPIGRKSHFREAFEVSTTSVDLSSCVTSQIHKRSKDRDILVWFGESRCRAQISSITTRTQKVATADTRRRPRCTSPERQQKGWQTCQ
jgi:hypothetical protein